MEIKHWFWIADLRKPKKMVGCLTESEFDFHLNRLKEEQEKDGK